ncbi:hypothetical protein EBZ39_07890 [bacterium]|nr:hypothetical protein [bacterium]
MSEQVQDVKEKDSQSKEGFTPDGKVDKDFGKEQVDFPDKKIEDRFKRIYRDLKLSDERNRMLQSKLEEVQGAASQIQTKLEQKEKEDAVSSIKSQIRQAKETGDDATVERLQEQLAEVLVEVKLAKMQKKPELEKKAEQQVVRETQDEIGRLTSDRDARIIQAWATEEDENGDPVRPWALISSHKKAAQATEMLTKILKSGEYDELSIEEKLQMIDEQISGKPNSKAAPAVMKNENAVKGVKKSSDALTPEEERVAMRLFRGKTPEEAKKLYLQGKKLTGK